MRIGRFMTVTDVTNVIEEHNTPALCLVSTAQAIANGGFHAISFASEVIDELGMWAIGDPTNIHTPNDALWLAMVRTSWAANVAGRRIVQMGGTLFPSGCNEIITADNLYDENLLYQMFFVDASNPLQVTVYQNSGGALNNNFVQLILVRLTDIAYPI